MQPYDIFMLIVLASTVLFGFWRGMAWQVASLASVLLSAVVAVNLSASVAPYCPGEEPWNRFLAILIIYAVTAAAIWLVFHFVSNVIDRIKLKEFDRQLGATFGLLKGILFCVVITFFAVTLNEQTRQMVLVSRSGDLIARGIRNANPILPEDIRTHLGKYIDELNEKLSTPAQPEAASPFGEPPLQPLTPPATPIQPDKKAGTDTAGSSSGATGTSGNTDNSTRGGGVGDRLKKLFGEKK